MKTLTVPAEDDRLEAVQDFVGQTLAAAGCPRELETQIQIAVEELFVNIAHYAYAPGRGEVEIGCALEAGSVVIRFRDRGVPFDPLAEADADVSLPAGERKIGGLGICLVKRIMDGAVYLRRDGQNILTVRKNLRERAGGVSG